MLARLPANSTEADICLVVEGAYPFVPGGVSSWIDWLMKSLGTLRFCVVALVAGDAPAPCYEFPPNMTGLHVINLTEQAELVADKDDLTRRNPLLAKKLADALHKLFVDGTLKSLEDILAIINSKELPLSREHLINSRLSWDIICLMYKELMPHTSFLHFFWAWRALFGGLFAALKHPLPKASVYHAVSTGYAGMFAARAAAETGSPAILTEHGIYTNERRVEISMATWVADTIDKGLSLDDARLDMRDVWLNAFDAYARCCYDACSVITSLYEDNARLQVLLGADGGKLKVIANGIETRHYNTLPRPGADTPPTIALIGRVVPIKDVKTYIAAAALIRQKVPRLKALVLGPVEEDPAYVRECRGLVAELGLEGCVEFTGRVKLSEYLPKVHVVVLTSLSEAQPLVLLEAGAASVPCVATDVGSCREILEGRSTEDPHLGRGGLVTRLASPEDTARAVSRLLLDNDEQYRFGTALQERVHRYYNSDQSRDEYARLYRESLEEA